MTIVIASVPDLFFASKIRATAEHLGINVKFIKSEEAIRSMPDDERPALILVDLQSTTPDPFELAHIVRSNEQLRSIPLVGFYSHLLRELQERAKEAGFTHVMPRSAFSNRLAEILAGNLLP